MLYIGHVDAYTDDAYKVIRNFLFHQLLTRFRVKTSFADFPGNGGDDDGTSC